MKDVIEKRIIQEANFTVGALATIRTTAKEFGVSKSTTHKDLTIRLKEVSPQLHVEVNKIMQSNKQERSLRGGEATKKKYKNIMVVS